MVYKAAVKLEEQHARAVATDQPISSKHSIEIATWIKGRTTSAATALLEKVIDKKIAVPFKRFHHDIGHRPNQGPGRYPQKASKVFLKLIKQVEANANVKGMDDKNLVIKAVVANRAPTRFRTGRQRGRQTKSTHIELIVQEKKQKSESKTKTTKKKATQASAKSDAQ